MGINWNISNETSNDVMTNGRDLSWLQDTNEQNVQESWGAAYRDVVILDPLNCRDGEPFNLQTNSLEISENYEALKNRLRGAAQFQDADNDGVGDDWETRFFGNLSTGGVDDPDGDSGDNFLEFALGSRPDDSADLAGVESELVEVDGGKVISLTYFRRLGSAGGLTYRIQRSEDGEFWADVTSLFVLTDQEDVFNGLGAEKVTYSTPVANGSSFLYRVRVSRD